MLVEIVVGGRRFGVVFVGEPFAMERHVPDGYFDRVFNYMSVYLKV